jgi:hypothetical protein
MNDTHDINTLSINVNFVNELLKLNGNDLLDFKKQCCDLATKLGINLRLAVLLNTVIKSNEKNILKRYNV